MKASSEYIFGNIGLIVETEWQKEISPINQVTNKPAELPTLKVEKTYDDITLFHNFWNSFKIAVHDNDSLWNVKKMSYLLSYLGGSVYNAISGFALLDKNYIEAIQVLKQEVQEKRYNN